MDRGIRTDIFVDVKKYLRGRIIKGNNILYRVENEREQAVGYPGIDSVSSSDNNHSELKKNNASVKSDHFTGSEQELEDGISYSSDSPVQDSLFEKNLPEKEDKLAKMDFEELKLEVSRCRRCGLSEKRTNTVFGGGSTSSRIVFLGEAPGKNEDLQGVPFVGRAGKLLDAILRAIDLKKEDVFITNILKCRPPGNRDPREDEVKACEGFLKRQLELIAPVVICALGRVAAQNLLRTKTPLGKLRGRIHYYNGVKTIVTYHPAALLRNPHFKRPTWEDMKLLKRIYSEAKG
ncbi:uracil-DNA glycosylase [bacterium]|nr:uracil-DNA glycosylase [bacterium]